jgi:hypothetical protein
MEAAIVAGKGFTPRQWRRHEKKLAKIMHMDRPGWRPARPEETPGQMGPELVVPVEADTVYRVETRFGGRQGGRSR